jgi:hypothetical protein
MINIIGMIFFDQIKIKVAEKTKNDVCQLLTADFSTTGKVESILSTASIMNTFKFYVKYQRPRRAKDGGKD